jgi:hypothetical protein
LSPAPRIRLPVGVLVERRPAVSPWAEHVWTPAAVLPGEPEAPIWSVVAREGDTLTFFAGNKTVDLYSSETGNYRDNLASGVPKLWVVLRPTGVDPPYDLMVVTADPAEGEGFAAGDDLVESVPMPASMVEAVADFIAEHHLEREFFKRKRDRADPEALGRKPPGRRGPDR